MFAQPIWGTVPKNTFLLNPKHQSFITGNERKFKDFATSLLVILGAVGLLFAMIGIGMAKSGFGEILARSQLAQSGVDARATVIATNYDTSTDENGTTYTYYMTYEYYVRAENSDSATRYTYHQQISSDNYLAFDKGSKITIQYLPNNPTVSRFMEDGSDTGFETAIIGSLFPCIALVVLYLILRHRFRNRRLENEGQLIIGKISQSSGSRYKGNYTVTIRYTFFSPDGVELERKEKLTRNDLDTAKLPPEGASVAVVYVNDKLFRIL